MARFLKAGPTNSFNTTTNSANTINVASQKGLIEKLAQQGIANAMTNDMLPDAYKKTIKTANRQAKNQTVMNEIKIRQQKLETKIHQTLLLAAQNGQDISKYMKLDITNNNVSIDLPQVFKDFKELETSYKRTQALIEARISGSKNRLKDKDLAIEGLRNQYDEIDNENTNTQMQNKTLTKENKGYKSNLAANTNYETILKTSKVSGWSRMTSSTARFHNRLNRVNKLNQPEKIQKFLSMCYVATGTSFLGQGSKRVGLMNKSWKQRIMKGGDRITLVKELLDTIQAKLVSIRNDTSKGFVARARAEMLLKELETQAKEFTQAMKDRIDNVMGIQT